MKKIKRSSSKWLSEVSGIKFQGLNLNAHAQSLADITSAKDNNIFLMIFNR